MDKLDGTSVNTLNLPSPHSSKVADSPETTTIEIFTMDIYSLSTSINITYTNNETTAVALANLGYIGNTPFRPSVAVSMKTLELYRILQRRKASFSVEGFVKVVCDLYTVGFPPLCINGSLSL